MKNQNTIEEKKKVNWISRTPQQSTSRILVEDTPSDHGQEQIEIEDDSNDSYMAELLSDTIKTKSNKPIIESPYQYEFEEEEDQNRSAIILDKSLEFENTNLIPIGPETQFAQNSLERNRPINFGLNHQINLESQELSNLSKSQQEFDISDSIIRLPIQRKLSLNHSPFNMKRNSLGFGIKKSSLIESDDSFQCEPLKSNQLDISLEGFQSLDSNHINQETIQSTIPAPHLPNHQIENPLEDKFSRIESMEIPLHSTCDVNFKSPNPDTSLPIIPITNRNRNGKSNSTLMTPPQLIHQNQTINSNPIPNQTSPITTHIPNKLAPRESNSPTPIKESQTPQPLNLKNPSKLLFKNYLNPSVFNLDVDNDIFDLTGEIISGLPVSQSQNTQDLFKNDSIEPLPTNLSELQNKLESETTVPILNDKEKNILVPSSSQDISNSTSHSRLSDDEKDKEIVQELNPFIDISFSTENESLITKTSTTKKINEVVLKKRIVEGIDSIDDHLKTNKSISLNPDDSSRKFQTSSQSIKLNETTSDESSFEPAPPTQINEPISLMKPPEKANKNGKRDSRTIILDQNITQKPVNPNPATDPSNPIMSGSRKDLQTSKDRRKLQKATPIPQSLTDSDTGQETDKYVKTLPETRSDESSFEPAPPTQINEPTALMEPPEVINKNDQQDQLEPRYKTRDQNTKQENVHPIPSPGPLKPTKNGSRNDPQTSEDKRQKEKLISQLEQPIESETGQQKTILPFQSSSSRIFKGKRKLISLRNVSDELFHNESITKSHLALNPSNLRGNLQFESGQESDKSIKTLPETKSDESSFEPAPPTQINEPISLMKPPEKVNKNFSPLNTYEQNGIEEPVNRSLGIGPLNLLTSSGSSEYTQRSEHRKNLRKEKLVPQIPTDSETGQETDKSLKTLPETRSDESSFEPAPPTQINEPIALMKPPKKFNKNGKQDSRIDTGDQNTTQESVNRIPVTGPSNSVTSDSRKDPERSEDKRILQNRKSITESETGQETDKSLKTLPETRSDESSFEPAPPTQINEPIPVIKLPENVSRNSQGQPLIARSAPRDQNALQKPVDRVPETGPSNLVASGTSRSTRNHRRLGEQSKSQRERSVPQAEHPIESELVQQTNKTKTKPPVHSGSSCKITQRKRRLMSLSSDIDEEIPLPSSSSTQSSLTPIPSLAMSKPMMTSTSIRNDGDSNQEKEKNMIKADNGQQINNSITTTLPIPSCSSNRTSQGKRKRNQIAVVNGDIPSSSLSAPESEHAAVFTTDLVQGTTNLTTASVNSNKRRKTEVKVTKTKSAGLVTKLTNRLTKRKVKGSKSIQQNKKKGKGLKKQEEKFPIQRVLVYDNELNGYRGGKLIGIQKEGIRILDDSGNEKVCQIEEIRKYEIKRGDLVKYLGNRFKDIESQRTDIRVVKSVIEVHKIQEDRIDLDPNDLVSLSSVIDYHRFCDKELLVEEIVIGVEFKLGELLVLGDESDQLSDRKLDEEVIEELEKLIEQANEKDKKLIKSEPCTPQIKNQPNRNLNRIKERNKRVGSVCTKIFEEFGLILTELKSPAEIKKGRNDRKIKFENQNQNQNNKEEIEIKLRSNGGKVIDGIDEMIEFIKPLKQFQINQKKRKIRSKSCPWQEDEEEEEEEEEANRKIEIVKKTNEFDRLKVILLLTDGPVKTLKYWLALALGIPCVSNQWVIDSCQEGVCLDWKSYLLSSGYSKHLKTFCFGNQREIYEKNHFDLKSILDSFENQNQNQSIENEDERLYYYQKQPKSKLFHDKTFYCLVKQSNKKEIWYNNVWWILCSLGVREIKFKSIEKFAEERLNELNRFDYILIDDELEINQKDENQFQNLVDLNWIKESLVFGKVLYAYR